MTRRKSPATPTFNPWDGYAITIRNPDHGLSVGRIAPKNPADHAAGWTLSWEPDYLPPSDHDDALHAVAAARDLYPEYLRAEEEANRESDEQERHEERFLNRQRGAIARATRVPMGGQRGWKNKPKPPTTEK